MAGDDLFAEAARERLAVASWPFRAEIDSDFNEYRDRQKAGIDLKDFLKNPMGPLDSPQSRLIEALINFTKPIVAAVHGAAIGGGTTMLTQCDFVYAGEGAKFQQVMMGLSTEEGFPHLGTIDFVDNRLDATTGDLLVRAVFANPPAKDGELRIGASHSNKNASASLGLVMSIST